jgi:hypothetical protein
MSIDERDARKLIEAIETTKALMEEHPLTAIKVCLDMQQVFRGIEQDAALRANGRFKISWGKLERALGKNAHWAWDRYVAYGLSHPKSRRRSTKLTPPEVKEKPEAN